MTAASDPQIVPRQTNLYRRPLATSPAPPRSIPRTFCDSSESDVRGIRSIRRVVTAA